MICSKHTASGSQAGLQLDIPRNSCGQNHDLRNLPTGLSFSSVATSTDHDDACLDETA